MADNSGIRIITRDKLEELIDISRSSERRRAPTPIHPAEYHGPQYLINPIQPDSYLRPHNHNYPEIWMPVRGRVMLISFYNDGEIADKNILSTREVVFYEMPPKLFHTAFALEEDSVFSNISQGPFNPKAAKSFPEWAPREEDRGEATKYLAELKRRVL